MDRRAWFQTVAGSLAAGLAGGAVACGGGGARPASKAENSGAPATGGCGATGPVDPRTPPPPPTVPAGSLTIPLAQVPVGARTNVCFQNVPIEVHRTESRVTARVLVCTHWGCTVRWMPEHNWYQCPCHDGKFDEDGDVKVGPPQKALLRVPVRVDGDTLILGT